MVEEIKQALEILKRECTKQDDCEGCVVHKLLGQGCKIQKNSQKNGK